MNAAVGQRRALFLDRDGSLIVEKDYLDDPAQVELLPGAAEAIARLNRAGWLVIVVTNQSGVARGLFDLDRVREIHTEIDRQLALKGARVDDWLVCPHHPDGVVPEYAVRCSCRKPEPGLLLQAAASYDIDLGRSVMAGDKAADVKAGDAAGCQSFLLLSGYGARTLDTHPELAAISCPGLAQLAPRILGG
ncbi:MAG: HAD family hydrolase [Deltaproteobacteria bacterium]|nr:MAG: HAD family hydrolase [Deltaproteobacteria bacterium]